MTQNLPSTVKIAAVEKDSFGTLTQKLVRSIVPKLFMQKKEEKMLNSAGVRKMESLLRKCFYVSTIAGKLHTLLLSIGSQNKGVNARIHIYGMQPQGSANGTAAPSLEQTYRLSVIKTGFVSVTQVFSGIVKIKNVSRDNTATIVFIGIRCRSNAKSTAISPPTQIRQSSKLRLTAVFAKRIQFGTQL